MKKTHFALAAIAGLSGIAGAATGPVAGTKFFLLSDFADAATDTAAFAKLYYGKTFDNAAQNCTAAASALAEGGQDFARLAFSLGASSSSAYYANVGLMLPLNNLWSVDNDMRAVTSIKFKAKASTALTVKVNFDGPAVPFGSGGYTPLKKVAVTTDWAWFQIKPSEFKFETWMKDDAKAGKRVIDLKFTDPTDNSEIVVPTTITARAVAARVLGADSAASPYYADDSVNLLKNVKLIQFGVDPEYDQDVKPEGTALAAVYAAAVADATLDIDSVLFEGVDGGWAAWENGTACTGPFSVLEDFSPLKDAPSKNYAEQYWFGFSDTSSAAGAATNKAAGISKVWGDDQDTTDPESPYAVIGKDGYAALWANLNKGNATTHPYAGFAELGTGLTGKATGLSLPGFKAFQFEILAGNETGDFDKAKLNGVSFKVAKASVGDSVTYAANINYDAIKYELTGEPQTICVDAAQLKQPSWYTGKVGVTPFAATDVKQISWALKIQKDGWLSAATSKIAIKSVKVYGAADYFPAVGVKGISARGTKGLVAEMTTKGLAVSFTVPGDKAQLEVVRLDGAKVASFTTAASVSNLSLPVSLQNGTYMVVVRGEGARQVVTLPVLGR